MEHALWEWAAFGGFVLVMLALDLGVFHRKDHAVGPREALAWSLVWIALALGFGAYVWMRHGADSGLEYLTGYVIEKSLSVDNIFVFVVIFGALGIPALYQHRVLFWGILSALVLRGAMIAAGAALLERFHWIIYVFGGFLVLTGVKLFLARGGVSHPEQSAVFRALKRVVPATPRLDGNRFFTVEGGRRLATPLFFALALIEFTDVVFAVDSIPAIFAITRDPFIVFTSNIFAILGLRSLYFLLASFVERFTYLKPSLAAVLVFVGAKMALVDVVKVHPAVSLGVVTLILATGVVASLVVARRSAASSGGSAGT
ncbi:TerC family protein [Anaeromyxobacter dehalogenans]|uniref:Integral membrane protein TerC n=1 Tax=Anaeromyxobacter dehalogenans (strain 2CP-C) TaxID=290397 RepID=Q2IK89_ANADE|nr:TerC family protein [Anaeromyxobacter dehalogenans]ABC82073.1 Integral membrane protein TerC [Anaeromyxobacter dehalogenans 2CP-C]